MKDMKKNKIWAWLIAICLIISSIPLSIQATVAESADTKLSMCVTCGGASVNEIKEGDILSVTVSLDYFQSSVTDDKDPLITTMQFFIPFDESIFEYVDDSMGNGHINAVNNTSGKFLDVNVDGNTIKAAAVYKDIATGALEETYYGYDLFSFELKVKENVDTTEVAELGFTNVILKNMDLEEPYTNIAEKISFTVAEPECEHIGGTATCTKLAECEVCGEAYGSLNEHNHTGTAEVRNAYDATCGKSGYTGDIHCSDCGKILLNGSYTEATGIHDWNDGEVEIEPTITTAGTMLYICKECGATKREEIPKLEQNPNPNPDPDEPCEHTGGTATCKDQAVCVLCGEAYGYLDGNNHIGEIEIRNGSEATCIEYGYTGDTYCKDCGELILTGSTVEPTGEHDWNAGEVVKEATTTEAGEKLYTCLVCKEMKSEEIPKLEVTPDPEPEPEPTPEIKIGKPQITVKNSGSKKVKITWKKVKNVTGYQVYRATAKKGKYKLVKTIKGKSFTNKGLKKGKRYYYKVRAYKNINGEKIYGAYSKVKSVKVKK